MGEKERKKKRKEQKKAQKAAGEAEKLRLQKLEEEAKLEAKRKKEVLEKKCREEWEQQRINEDGDYLEEQRMQEGRRMFQMFAARMIEQRLLVAYREKCALEAQEQLIREEEEAERTK